MKRMSNYESLFNFKIANLGQKSKFYIGSEEADYMSFKQNFTGTG